MYVIPNELLVRAAQPTVDAIVQLKRALSETLEAVMGELGEHFFDPGYGLEDLLEATGIGDHWLKVAFRREIGLTPWTFVRECRLEMAARLLRDTSLKVPDICILIGYSSVSNFRHIFRRWSGLRPRSYGRCARRVRERAGRLLDDAMTWIYRDRARRGELTTAEARQLIEYLEELYEL